MDNNINNQNGFTLIELLTAVAILTILASIAIPTYRGYQRSAARSEATTNLTAVALCLDEYYAQEGSFTAGTYSWAYAGDSACTETATVVAGSMGTMLTNCFKPRKGSGSRCPRYSYQIIATSTGYTASATGRSGTINAGDTMGINQDGAKSGSWPK